MKTNLLYKYFNGMISPAEMAQVKSWFESSPRNRDFFMKERKIHDAILLLKNGGDIDSLLVRKTEKRIRRWKIVRRSLQTAAVIAICVLAVWNRNLYRNASELAQQTHTISVPAGQRANVILPDGSNVWLNSLSTLEYNSAFQRKSRTVALDGQAYFDVAQNKEIPFIVRTGKCAIEVTGTKFDVNAYSNSERFEAMLMEGRIRVTLNNDASNPVLLTPDTKVELHEGRLVRSFVNNLDPYKWKEGLICFTETGLPEILRQFEKTFDVRIVLDSGLRNDIRYTGKFRMSEGLHYALRVLQRERRFVFEEDRDNNIIHIKHP